MFAPHYAEAVRRALIADAPLCAGRSVDAQPLAMLRVGEPFDLLDVTGDRAWGIAVASGLVGYLDADALSAAAPA